MLIIGDVHGELDLLKNLLENVKDDDVYLTGDLIDRGDKGLETLLFVREKSYNVVRGNHEDMFLKYWDNKDFLSKELWISNGGHSTLKEFELLDEIKQQEIITYLQKMPLYYYFKELDLMISHAGVCGYKIFDGSSLDENCNKVRINQEVKFEELLKFQNSRDFIWSREEFIYAPNLKEMPTIFIVGHTFTFLIDPFIKKPSVLRRNNAIFIDCGAFNTGVLAAIQILNNKLIAHYFSKEKGYYREEIGKLR